MQHDEAAYVAERSGQLAARTGLSRRDILRLGALLPVAAGIARLPAAGVAHAATAAASPIVKPLPPEWFISYGTNAEMRWDSVQDLGHVVPNERFFVRDHTATPLIDERSWRLEVVGSGLAGSGITLSYDDLRRMPQREVLTAVECAGNGRSFFGTQQGTPAPGTQWGLGAIGVARWRGVPLRAVLERAGISEAAVDVMPVGLDGTVVSGGVDYGHVRRPLPVAKALDDAILALAMNGEDLPPDHGFPVRLVVPGWIGVASVKWVGRIEVSDEPLFSYWNTQQYVMTGDAYPDRPVLGVQTVKSAWELATRRDPGGRPSADAHRTGLVGVRPDRRRRRQRRPRSDLVAGPAAGPSCRGCLDVVPVRRPRAGARRRRAVGARSRHRRTDPAAHGAVQHQRLPVRRRRASPGPVRLTRGTALVQARV